MKHLIWIMFATGLAMAQRSEELFQQALMKERSQGDLKGAIEIYQRIAKDKDRKLAARALLEMARCQEKQGGEQARKTYELLLKDFGDQSEAVAAARTRMAALTVTASLEPRVRRVLSGTEAGDEGSISPDGRFLSGVDWDTGDLAIRDVVTNATRRLTNTGGWEKSGAFADSSRFSQDGKRLAYNWYVPGDGGKSGHYEIRVINADGSGERTIARMDRFVHPVPAAWSVDGRWIAFTKTQSSNVTLHLVDSANGEVRDLPGTRGMWISPMTSFSPDGKWLAFAGRPTAGAAADIYVISQSGGDAVAVVQHPSADNPPFWSADGKRILFTSDRSGGWGLWQIPIVDGRPAGAATAIRSNIAPKLNPLGITANGVFAYSTPFSNQEIYAADLDPRTGRMVGKPALVSEQNPGVKGFPSLSPDGKRIAYRTGLMDRDGVDVTVRDLTTGKETSIPAGRVYGTAWDRNGTRVLIETIDNQKVKSLQWFDPAAGKLSLLRKLDGPTNAFLPVMSPVGGTVFGLMRMFPASQRYGLAAIDVATAELRIVYEEEFTTNGSLKGPAVSPDGKLLATIRSVTGKDSELIVVPAAGGPARVIAKYASLDKFFTRPAFTHDGKGIFVTRGRGSMNKTLFELVRIDIETGAIQPTGIEMPSLFFPVADPSGRKIYFQSGGVDAEIWLAENIIPAQ